MISNELFTILKSVLIGASGRLTTAFTYLFLKGRYYDPSSIQQQEPEEEYGIDEDEVPLIGGVGIVGDAITIEGEGIIHFNVDGTRYEDITINGQPVENLNERRNVVATSGTYIGYALTPASGTMEFNLGAGAERWGEPSYIVRTEPHPEEFEKLSSDELKKKREEIKIEMEKDFGR